MLTIFTASKPSDGASKYVSFQTFAALVDARTVATPTLAVFTLRDAFDSKRSASDPGHEAYVTAAAQWMLHLGEQIYSEALKNGKGALFGESEPWATLRQWRRWHDGFKKVSEGKANRYAEDCRSRAGRAVDVMDSIKQKLGG